MSTSNLKGRSAAELAERRSLEAQLLQAQKMEGIGHMAGSIAHDVNNILHVIVGFGSLALGRIKEDDPLRYNLNQIIAAAGRASNLTRSLLDLSRKLPAVPEPVDLHQTLMNVKSFLDMIIGEEIRLQMACTSEALEVIADSGQLEQVVINLATNARHAMPNGGTLSIVTQSVRIDAETAGLRGCAKPGSYALISVTDDGTGMDHDTASRVFEPFFTTKQPGDGTGLGLSIVYRIIKEHNGFIEVSSELGKGTTIRLYLPLTDAGQRSEATSTLADADRTTEMQQAAGHDSGNRISGPYRRVFNLHSVKERADHGM